VKHAEVVLKGLLSEHGASSPMCAPKSADSASRRGHHVCGEGRPEGQSRPHQVYGQQERKVAHLARGHEELKPTGIPHSIFLENLFARTYDAGKLDEDTERVRLEYQNRGYFTVVVQDRRPRFAILAAHPG